MEKYYNSVDVERKCRDLWQQHQVNAYAQPSNDDAAYTIMMPPANVTGSLHVGHALTFTLQDTLIRFHRMHNKQVLWQPGTDHAGIATQTRVIQHLQQEGIDTSKLSREEILDHIWRWKDKHAHIILDQLQMLGSSAQWERTRFTMDDGLSHAVTAAFVQLHKDGLIFRKKTLVNWDTKLQTAISDLEILQKTQKDTLYHIAYQTDHGPLTVATTRPETMFGDTALAVHPDDPRYQKFIGKTALIPIIDQPIPIVADHHAQPDKGSGVVKITPAHDFNDYEVGQRHQLPLKDIMNPDGTLNNAVPEAFRGLSISEGRRRTLQALHDLGAIAHEEVLTHQVPYGDRSQTIIEPRLTDQWFVDAKPMAEKALQAFKSGEMKFFPQRWGGVFQQWMENIQPWCISRQIIWGHRVPVWWADDQTYFVAQTAEEAQEMANQHFGHPNTTLTQDSDVLDTWFSSGLWPFATLGWPLETPPSCHFPSNVLVTGFDIIFFWVARMAMMSLQLTQSIPFHHVYIHGLIRDEKGQKMSKSKGNVINPLSILDEYGADSLRMTLLQAASPGQDVRLSKQSIVSMRNFCTKIWNTARYAHMHQAPRTTQCPTTEHPLNRWIIYRVATLNQTITQAFAYYGFQEIALKIYQEFWHEFCDWYIEGTKPLLTGHYQEETRLTLGFVLSQFLLMIHPLMPHITEEIWQSFGATTPIAVHAWPKITPCESQQHGCVQWFKAIVNQLRSYQKKLPMADMVCSVWSTNDEHKHSFEQYKELFKHFTQVPPVYENRSSIPMTLCLAPSASTTLFITAPHMDLAHEKNTLQTEIAALTQQHTNILERIKVQDKAPETTLQGWRDHALTTQKKIQALQDTLQRFANVQS